MNRLKEVQKEKQACLVTHLTESMTKTTSSIVILVSAMFVERIICNREKITNLLNDKVNTPAKQLSGMPVADHAKTWKSQHEIYYFPRKSTVTVDNDQRVHVDAFRRLVFL